ncbi:MAG: hypothetical protein A2W99_14035 [Bacteroidetes bacterium GWF2_33_16]|nr:MAG: hypothetical protein A2X00_05965 [Bacteroidetes bacterium GWE2_32_14]OFY04746.1 MAG: hypothetical protein A2W99_14035 [Bacteroidetes bacterium GWF2_33_16]
MFRTYYHYFIAGLPEIFFDDSEISFRMPEFKKELEENIKPKDYKLLELIFLAYDNENLLHFLKEEFKQFNPLGKYTIADFEIEFSDDRKNILPNYMYQFYSIYKDEEQNQKINRSWENLLTELYFDYVLQTKNSFLKQWFEFNQNIKNILTGINCRKFNLNPERQLIGKSFITDSILKNTSKDFGLDVEFPVVIELLNITEKDNLLTRERDLDILRWKKIDELTLFEYFTIDVVLAFTIKLDIAYRWLLLDEETGRKIFKQIIIDLKKSFEFPKEFTLNGKNR